MKKQNNTPNNEERFVQAQYIREDCTIEVYPGYVVSNWGRVASWRNTNGDKRKTMKILKLSTKGRLGYLYTNISINSKVYQRSVHRLVLSSFRPGQWARDKNEVDHIDRDVTNNFLDNLHWVSRNENFANRGIYALKKIRVTYLSDGHTETFDSLADGCRAFGKNLTWCNWLIREHNGFHEGLNIIIEKI